MFNYFSKLFLCDAVLTAVFMNANGAHAVDFHAFEFNESFGFFLSETSDSGTPGGAAWVESNNLTDSETDGAGNFRIAKFNDLAADNYLQIDNIDATTSGSRYIVVRMSGWDFYDSVVGEGEEIRFDFLDNDTGTSGSTITSQIRIDRNTDNGNIELRGTAIGVGSSDIDNRTTLNTTQTAPFTMVLELNKTSNTYEVFYKDGTNPSQSLGSDRVAPDRNGNSIRFTVNNNFGSTIDEFFAIDRIALTDTNPLTDLMTLEVDRITGEMKLINTTGAALSGLRSYSITSAAGALNATNWKSVTDFYDQAPGNGSVDPDGAWSKTSTTTDELSEGVVGGDGGNLAINQEIILSMGTGPWIKSIYEDLEITLNFDGGITRKANVNFIGNSGKRFAVGDLNFDGQLTAADWTTFNAGGEVDLDALSRAQQYQAGDLNDDGENNIFDFAIFKDAYEAANGLGSFDAMLASIPEPTGAVLLSLGSALLLTRRRPSARLTPTIEVASMTTRLSAVLCLGLFFAAGSASAAVLEDFQFNDANGTLLGAAVNTGTGTGNMWNEDTTDMDNSSAQNGVYRIQKSSAVTPSGFGTNFLDIGNVTTGKVWLVAELAGWNFASGTTNPNDFDPSQLEEIRFDFLDNDGSDQGGSTVTAEVEIERISSGAIEIHGVALGGGGSIAAQPLSLSQTDPFTVVLALDKTNNNYEILTKNGAGAFASLGGPAPISSTRAGNSIRFVANNSFAGAGEFFDIDRIYLTDTDPTNVTNDRLTLQVNTATGELKLRNTTATTFDIDAYTITSSTLAGDLNLAGWSSLSDKVPLVDPVDGPDADSTPGNGVGETWDEAPGSSNKVLAERFLLGSSVFPTGREISLGNAFQIGGDTGLLSFQYRNADTGAIVSGVFDFISTGPTGDYDNDGDVDGRDFLVWQRGNSPTPLSATDLAAWQANYGTGGLLAVQAVPEPTALLFGIPVVLGSIVRRRVGPWPGTTNRRV